MATLAEVLYVCGECGAAIGPQPNHTRWHNRRGEVPSYAPLATFLEALGIEAAT